MVWRNADIKFVRFWEPKRSENDNKFIIGIPLYPYCRWQRGRYEKDDFNEITGGNVMKKISLTLICIVFVANHLFSQPLPPVNPNYEVVFVDEFNGNSINEDNWKNTPPWNQQGYHQTNCNNIPNGLVTTNMYGYRKKDFTNCVVASGKLSIVSKKEQYSGRVDNWYDCSTDSCSGLTCSNSLCWKSDIWRFNYTTNRLWSYDKFKYGYIEICCQISQPTSPKTNQGIGPNFWMWDKYNNETTSELDIFEFNGSTGTFCPNIHYRQSNNSTYYHWNPGNSRFVNFNSPHTFAAHWLPQKISILLDNNVIETTSVNASNLNAMPLIIDVNLPADNYCDFIDPINTQFPHYYDIYFVKVYQLKNKCTINYHLTNLSTAEYGQYRTIMVSGSGYSVNLTSGQNMHLIATNSITIDKNFSVPIGATFCAEVYPEVQSEHQNFKSAIIEGPPPSDFYDRHY
jgi:hypothetical protein